MSMLAERKRKTKWVINPTKKPLWNEDSNGIKFGRELMEKMGWSAGKGLGAKEQGIHEPLKVSYKNDTKGMGFKGNDNDWIEHQDEFNVLLSQLSNNDNESEKTSQVNKIKSLEDKSKHSRARVHYQKFTRGKDLSRYSENDLACILGVNKSKMEKSKQEEETKTESDNCTNEFETSFGVTTINSGSLHDYFKKKWTINKNKQENLSQSFETGNITEQNPISEQKSNSITNEEEEEEINNKKHKKKKRKSKTDSKESEIENNQKIIYSEDNLLDSSPTGTEFNSFQIEDETGERKHKKKKHKSKTDSELLEITESENLDTTKISEEIVEKKKKSKIKEINVEEGSEIKKKKKKKDKEKDENKSLENSENIQHLSDSESLLPNSSEENMKMIKEEKKTKKKKSKSEREAILVSTENINQNGDLSYSESEKLKKNKSESNPEIELDQKMDFKASETVSDKILDKKAHKKKHKLELTENEEHKSKKRRKTCSDGNNFANENSINNLSDNESICVQKSSNDAPEECNIESDVKEKKSKKKHKTKSRDEVSYEGTESAINGGENLEPEIKKKKFKKSKHKSDSESESLDAENFQKSAELENCEKRRKKHKKSKRSDDSNEIIKTEAYNIQDNEIINRQTCDNDSENQKISSGKKEKKEKKGSEISAVEFEKESRKLKKQKANPENDMEDIPSDKHKKKKTKDNSHNSSSNASIDTNENEISVEKSIKKKKKKENKYKEDKNENEKEKTEENISMAEEIKNKSDDNEKVSTSENQNGGNGISENVAGSKQSYEKNVKGSENVKTREIVRPINRNRGNIDKYNFKKYTSEKVLDLIRWADIKEFRGSNLGNVLGYGFKKEYLQNAF